MALAGRAKGQRFAVTSLDEFNGGKPVYLYNLFGMQRFRWEGEKALTPGKHTLEFDFKYDGLGAETLKYGSPSGLGQGGTGYLKVDGEVVATKKIEKTIPRLMQ